MGIFTNLAAVARRFVVSGARFAAFSEARFQSIAPEVERIGVDEVSSVTPVDTRKLQESTGAQTSIRPGLLRVSIVQPAMSSGGEQYGEFVITGHHTRSGSWVEANPYPSEAVAPIESALYGLLVTWPHATGQALLAGGAL